MIEQMKCWFSKSLRARLEGKTRSARVLLIGVLWGAVAVPATAQVIGFEVPFGGSQASCNGGVHGYSGTAPTLCMQNMDTDWSDGIGELNTVALRMDGERVCGTDAPAHGGSCYLSLLRNANDGFMPTAPWNGSWQNGAPDQQGAVFNVSSTGVGMRSISVFSRANPIARYANTSYGGYPGGNGLIQIYSRNTTAGVSGWTLQENQQCPNTAVWTQCTVDFTIPADAQQVAFLLAPAPDSAAAGYISVDFDDVDLSGLFPVIVANDDSYTVPNTGSTTTSVVDNDTVDGAAAIVGTNVSVLPGTAPTPAAGSISMGTDGTITVAAGTTPGSYSYPYQVCALPALNPAVCASAVATIVIAAAATPAPVPTLGQWALLLLSSVLLLLGMRAFRRCD